MTLQTCVICFGTGLSNQPGRQPKVCEICKGKGKVEIEGYSVENWVHSTGDPDPEASAGINEEEVKPKKTFFQKLFKK